MPMANTTKKYFESSLTRFLYWPKKTLTGIKYHYQSKLAFEKNHNKGESLSPYHEEKFPRSSSLRLRVIAVFIYPIFTPLAFLLRLAGNLRREYSLVKQDTFHDKKLGNIYRDNIRKKFYTHGDYKKLHHQFRKHEKKLNVRWNDLKYSIKTEEDWDNPNIIKEFDDIFTEATLNFPSLINAMVKSVNSEKIQDSSNLHSIPHVAHPFNKQAHPLPSEEQLLANEFLDSVLIDMYHTARTRLWMMVQEYKMGDHEEVFCKINYPDKDMTKHKHAEDFYTRGTLPYKWRKGYNTNMKLFFSHFAKEELVKKADNPFEVWTCIDTSKNETNFRPYPRR